MSAKELNSNSSPAKPFSYQFIIGSIFVIIFGIASALGYSHYKREIQSTIKTNKKTANALARIILEQEKAADGVIQSYARRPLLIAAAKKRDFHEALKHLANLKENNPEVDTVFITDQNGYLWVNFPVQKGSHGKNFSNRDWYKGVSKEWKPYVSAAYKRIIGEKDLAIAVCAPIFDEGGKTIGILGISQPVPSVEDIVQPILLDPDIKVTLIDQGGHIIYSNRFPFGKEVTPFPPSPFLDNARRGENGEIEFPDPAEGNRVKYVAFAPVGRIGWSVIVEKGRRDILTGETEYFILNAMISSLLFSLSVLSVAYFRKRFIIMRMVERQKTDETIRKNEEQFRLITDSLPVLISYIDTDQRFRFVNQKYGELFGHSRKDIIGKQVKEIIGENAYGEIRSEIEKVLAGESVTYEKIIPYKHGEARYTKSHLIPHLGEDGKLQGFVTLVHDITESKKIESELRKHREHLEELVKERTAQLERVNEKLEREIGEHRKADAALQESEEKYRGLYDSSKDGIVMVDMQGYILECNQAYMDMLGYTKDEIRKFTYVQLTPPKWHSVQSEIIEDQIIKKGYSDEFEKEYIRKDGTEFPISTKTWLIRNKQGEPIGMWGIARDITERKQAEENIKKLNADLVRRAGELEVINKELDAFSYSVSHDLRAPLRAIDGFSQILLEDHRDKLDEEGKRVFGVIRRNTKKMGQLIDNLLRLSRLGRQEIRKTEMDMEKLAQTVFKEIALGEPGRKIQFTLRSLPRAFGDAPMIRQVFINLLANAWKFTQPREPATIEVGTASEEIENIYYVRDNGVGFDMQYVGKLFGVFQRLHRDEEFEGTGIGLAIVQRIIHRHGGRVWAESKVNGGAKFCFSLPKGKTENGTALKEPQQ